MKKLFKVDVCGISYQILAASPKELWKIAEGVDVEGYTDPSKAEIYMVSTVPDGRYNDTLLHELQHAIFEASGLSSQLQELLGLNDNAIHNLEEVIIRIYTPALHTTLRSAGWKAPRRKK